MLRAPIDMSVPPATLDLHLQRAAATNSLRVIESLLNEYRAAFMVTDRRRHYYALTYSATDLLPAIKYYK